VAGTDVRVTFQYQRLPQLLRRCLEKPANRERKEKGWMIYGWRFLSRGKTGWIRLLGLG
jgi:hypothetical protein